MCEDVDLEEAMNLSQDRLGNDWMLHRVDW
jgi:hypothetical protein